MKGSGLAPWPARLLAPPPRLADFGYSDEMFEKDTVIKINKLSVNVCLISIKYSCIFSPSEACLS